jgi:hypothetical protein
MIKVKKIDEIITVYQVEDVQLTADAHNVHALVSNEFFCPSVRRQYDNTESGGPNVDMT